MGDAYTIADIATFPWVNNLFGFYDAGGLVGMADFPHVLRALAAFMARPAVVRDSGFQSAFEARRIAPVIAQRLAARELEPRPGGHTIRGRPLGLRLDQQEHSMVTYVGLMSFTDKGIQSIKDTTKRAAAAKEMAKKHGVNMRDILWTMGEYDIVCVLEAEDETTLAAFSLATAMQGNVRSRSLRAYSATEMDKVLAKLP